MSVKGILIPIGGNEEKDFEGNEGYSHEFVKDGILSRVVKESGGLDAYIVVITTASRIPVEVGDIYIKAFDHLGCSNFRVLDIRTPEDAESADNIKHIQKADCVMFSGGDQSRITSIIGGTIMHDILKERYLNERFVIAGTSAGAMAMSTEMIAGGSSTEALFKGSVDMSKGLDLIPGLIIDSHFVRRGRFGRVAEAVAIYPDLLGVGLAEDTGLVIENGNKITVIGSGMVIIFDPSELMHNNEKILPVGTPMTMTNLKVHVLANSDAFLLNEREIHVLPLEAEFE